MNRVYSALDAALKHPAYIAAVGACGAAALAWLSVRPPATSLNEAELLLIALAFGLSLLGLTYSVNVRVENIILRKIAEDFYEINRLYRSQLMLTFRNGGSSPTIPDRLKAEAETLRAVLQRVSRIFMRVTGRHCVATIKLLTEIDGQLSVSKYVRSEDLSLRDLSDKPEYSLKLSKNTAFAIACEPRRDGIPRHFFSPDLRIERNYHDERVNFQRFYRSLVAVPIQGLAPEDSNDALSSDIIGFLVVDTMSVNRLNDNYHVFMMSALASQMHDFISLMRGRYVVPMSNPQ